MEKKALKEKIISTFDSLCGALNIGYIEVVFKEGDAYSSFAKKCYKNESEYSTYDQLKENNEFLKNPNAKDEVKFEMKTAANRDIHCVASPIHTGGKNYGLVIFESDLPFGKTHDMIFSCYSRILAIAAEALAAGRGDESASKKNRADLMSLRSIQASLFPKFENITGLDIGSVYLPAELMSGNFIDAMNIDDDQYQIVVCDISGYDAASSFAGGAIRTLLRTSTIKNPVPSALIEQINVKLSKIISAVRSLIFLTVYQINTKTGRAQMSSYGDINTIFFSKKKGKSLNINNTEIGKNLSKRLFIRDIAVQMEQGDILLFYSMGVKNATTEDGNTQYGEARLVEIVSKNIDSSSIDIVRELTGSISDFMNYSPLETDVILICIKKI